MSAMETTPGKSSANGPPVAPLNRLFQSPKSPRVDDIDETRITGSATILQQADDSVKISFLNFCIKNISRQTSSQLRRLSWIHFFKRVENRDMTRLG